MANASYLKIANITLGYNFPSKQIQKMNLKGLRLYLQIDNLFLLTKYSGWDPEVNSNLDPRFAGVDLFSVPQPRTYSIGVNINL